MWNQDKGVVWEEHRLISFNFNFCSNVKTSCIRIIFTQGLCVVEKKGAMKNRLDSWQMSRPCDRNVVFAAIRKKSRIIKYLSDIRNLSQQLSSWQLLETIISHNLKWKDNITAFTNKAHQMYYLRQLKKLNLSRTILFRFYVSVIESILTFFLHHHLVRECVLIVVYLVPWLCWGTWSRSLGR